MLHRVDLSLQVDGLARPYKVPFSSLPAPKAMQPELKKQAQNQCPALEQGVKPSARSRKVWLTFFFLQ